MKRSSSMSCSDLTVIITEYENVIINNTTDTKTIEIVTKEKHDLAFDSETHAFVEMLTKLRSRFKHDDPKTNTGLVINSVIKTSNVYMFCLLFICLLFICLLLQIIASFF